MTCAYILPPPKTNGDPRGQRKSAVQKKLRAKSLIIAMVLILQKSIVIGTCRLRQAN